MKDKALYLKTNDMAKMIGYSKDYLLKNRGVFFFENIHYFSKERRTDWKVSKVIEWVENKNVSDKAKNILDLVS
ncbi:hypothetical protein [Sulfurovum sp.]|uniref:hypothetical protein n=1 Tax=Sulfurovum sp. TaxID=1969726 RepID=UPI0025E86B75|nr:hypothetical protein [Sulfurovum sp.]